MEGVSPRIITTTFKTTNKKVKLCVIQYYAPKKNDKDEPVKRELYKKLQHAIHSLVKGNIIFFLIGDLNVNLGKGKITQTMKRSWGNTDHDMSHE